MLGYDIDPDKKGVLKINPQEAKIIQLIFETYRELRSFRQIAQKINKMGYRTKSYKSRREHVHGNKKFTKNSIAHILRSPVYIGKVTHKGDVFEGRHEAIIDEQLWQDVNDHIAANRVVRRKPRPQNMHTFLHRRTCPLWLVRWILDPDLFWGKEWDLFLLSMHQCK